MPTRAVYVFTLDDYAGNYAGRLRKRLLQHSTSALDEAREDTVGPHKMQTDAGGEDRASVGPPAFSLLGTLDELPDGFGSAWDGEIYPPHAADNSPLWSEDQEGINQTGENYPADAVLGSDTRACAAGDAKPPNGLGKVNPVFKRHKTPLSEDMRLLLILRENTLIWRRVPKYH